MSNEDKNILIIDDDVMVADLLGVLLSDRGYQTRVVNSAEAGIREFSQTRFNLVLCDIFMEGMGGLDGITKMRASRAEVPIIAMSAGYNDMTADKALKAAKMIGASGVLAKPFDAKQMLSAVDVFLNKAASEQDEEQS